MFPINFNLINLSKGIEVKGPKVYGSFEIFGIQLDLTETIVVQWVVVAIIIGILLIVTTGMKVVPTTKRQALAEMIYKTLNNFVSSSMNEGYSKLAPYIGALFSFSMISSLMPLLVLRAPTANLMVTATWAILTFIMVYINRFRTGGVGGFFGSFFKPVKLMLPLNIMSDFIIPVALAIRHFANLIAGLTISQLIAYAFTGLSESFGLTFPIFRIGIPAVLSLYFDLFTSVMQAFVFCMLTMVYIYNADLSAEKK